MSPEQEQGTELTPASDIYSFGLVLMETLLGQLPGAMTAPAARLKRLDSLRTSDLPRSAQRITEECLALEPRNRPQSARDVGKRLAKVIGVQEPRT